MMNEGNSGNKNQTLVWASTISEVDMDPAYKKTTTNESPMATS